MKGILKKIKNNTSLTIGLIIVCFLIFLVVTPHYDENGANVVIGKYYTERSAKLQKKVDELKEWDEKSVIKLTSMIVNLKKDKKELEEQNEKLTDQITVLTDKLAQQEKYYKTQDEEIKEEKKVSFSNVSRKEVRNDRPEFGNSFSKAIKKTKIDL